MKYTAALIAASAAVASAQVVYNQTTGTWICPAYSPNGAFCAGNSLQTNIIIRCSNGIGQPGNCNDNMAGYPPQGVSFAPCFQTSPNAGDATCSKNCIVYYPNRQFTIPGCTPISPTSSSSTSESTSSHSSTTTSDHSTTTSDHSTTTSDHSTTTSDHSTSTTTRTTIVPPPLTPTPPPSNITSTTIVPPPLTPTFPPSNVTSSTTHIVPPPITTGQETTTIPTNATTTTHTIPPPVTKTSTLPNGSVTTFTVPPTSISTLPNGSLTTVTFSPTRTPVGPSATTSTPVFTGAADRNAVAGMAVGLGAAVVMLL